MVPHEWKPAEKPGEKPREKPREREQEVEGDWETKEEEEEQNEEEQEEGIELEEGPGRLAPKIRVPLGREVGVPPRVVRALTRRYIPTPANVGGPPKTPAEILSKREPEPPKNDRDAHLKWQARDELRFFGLELRRLGLPNDSPNDRKSAAIIDAFTVPYRRNISEFLNAMTGVDRRLVEVEALQKIEKASEKERDPLHRALSADLKAIDHWLASTDNLRRALNEWAEVRRAPSTDWQKLQKAQLEVFKWLGKIPKPEILGDPLAMKRVAYLEGIAREVARQSSEHFAGVKIDFGAPLDGVASRARLGSQSERKSEEYRTRIEEYRTGMKGAAARGLSKMIEIEFGEKMLGPKNVKAPWRAELIGAIGSWEQEIKNFPNPDVGIGGHREFVKLNKASEELLLKTLNARKQATGVPGSTDALRNLNSLLAVASEQLRERAKEGGARALSALSEVIKKFGKAVARAEVAPDPLSDFWESKTKAALGELSEKEQNKIKDWFSADLTGRLGNWVKTIENPSGDAAKMAAESEDMLNALLRSRDIIEKLVADPSARAKLSEAIESLRIAVSNKLEKANERFKEKFV